MGKSKKSAAGGTPSRPDVPPRKGRRAWRRPEAADSRPNEGEPTRRIFTLVWVGGLSIWKKTPAAAAAEPRRQFVIAGAGSDCPHGDWPILLFIFSFFAGRLQAGRPPAGFLRAPDKTADIAKQKAEPEPAKNASVKRAPERRKNQGETRPLSRGRKPAAADFAAGFVGGNQRRRRSRRSFQPFSGRTTRRSQGDPCRNPYLELTVIVNSLVTCW